MEGAGKPQLRTAARALAAAIALALVAAPAWARDAAEGIGAAAAAGIDASRIDVDRIEVRSALGEPLLAEIPIAGAGAADLAQVRAQLAPAVTFARIGLPRPRGVVADLRFEVLRGPRPVIRVTSMRPVTEDFLTFLLQVDAPQRRIVREYSIALAARPALPDALPPPILAPTPAPDARIARTPRRAGPAGLADPADAPPRPVEAAAATPAPTAPPIPVVETAPRPAPLHSDRPAPPLSAWATSSPPERPAFATPAPRPPGPDDYAVKPGDNLTRIVSRLGFEGVTTQQAMLALLRTNPGAFAFGNINLLRQGAVLRRPPAAELDRLDASAAEAMVRLQIEQWRSGEMPDPPATAPAAAAAADAIVAPASVPAAARAMASARLEITPGAGSTAPGAGASVASVPDLERARAAADQVAARYTEAQELRARIADLEQAQAAQRRLIALQQRQLASPQPATAGFRPWLIAALAVLVALLAMRRTRGTLAPGRVARRLGRLFGNAAPPASQRATG